MLQRGSTRIELNFKEDAGSEYEEYKLRQATAKAEQKLSSAATPGQTTTPTFSSPEPIISRDRRTKAERIGYNKP